jgi:hypothetical protein
MCVVVQLIEEALYYNLIRGRSIPVLSIYIVGEDNLIGFGEEDLFD